MSATVVDACARCLRRTDLIAALAGRIEVDWRLRRGRPQLLAMPDGELLDWAGDPVAGRRYETFRAEAAAERVRQAGLGAVCRCSSAYPAPLHELTDPPAVLHVAGDLAALGEAAAGLVGARRASAYGLEVARSLGRELATAGVAVVSGMAMGVDSASHAGALEAGGTTVAVLATGADRPYPARARLLHARIAETACVVSEMPPGFEPRRWAFPARNRLIAALSALTVVVEGGERSGSLITADFAAELGRPVGAVPGPVTSRLAAGPHALLKAGAEVVRGPDDVLDLLHGAGLRDLVAPSPAARPAPVPADLEPRLLRLLDAVERGHGSVAELITDPADGFTVISDLGELELRGLVRRVFGGRYIRAAG